MGTTLLSFDLVGAFPSEGNRILCASKLKQQHGCYVHASSLVPIGHYKLSFIWT